MVLATGLNDREVLHCRSRRQWIAGIWETNGGRAPNPHFVDAQKLIGRGRWSGKLAARRWPSGTIAERMHNANRERPFESVDDERAEQFGANRFRDDKE